MVRSSRILKPLLALTLACAASALAQQQPLSTAASAPAPHRTRLILKDGSYQIVMSYTVAGNVVRFVSAERDGETEVIPLALVDLDATKRWEQQHTPGANGGARPAPILDPELAKEEADRAAMSPEVAPDLRLPEEESVLALDAWHGAPELIPLTQSDGELNRQTGHNILKGILNPRASTHQIVVLRGERAAVQLHVSQPVLYLRIGDPVPTTGSALTVDTHGAANRQDPSSAVPKDAEYVIVRTDVRQDARIVLSFDTSILDNAGPSRQGDAIPTDTETLPGGHWRKIVPREPLLFGEYALVEVLSDREINLGVWDFGVHPTAPENRDAVKPQPKRPLRLEPRRADPPPDPDPPPR